MKLFLLLIIAAFAGASSLSAQENDFFTETELFTALNWGVPDSTARDQARFLAAEDPAVQATIPELRDLGPIASTYSEDFLALLSLVSPEANKKAQRYLIDLHGRRELNSDERAKWEARRTELRKALIKAGKLPPG